MSVTLNFHDGPLMGHREVRDGDTPPREVVVEGPDGSHYHYVSTGMSHSVNRGGELYGYTFVPEDDQS